MFTGTMHQNNNLIFLGKTTSGMLDNEGRGKKLLQHQCHKTNGWNHYIYIYIYYFSSYFRVDLLEKSFCIQIPYPTLVFVSSTPPPKKTMEGFFEDEFPKNCCFFCVSTPYWTAFHLPFPGEIDV